MNVTNLFIAVLVIVVVGIILGLIFFARRKRSNRFQDKYGPEYAHTVKTMGNEKKAQTELDGREKRVETLNILPLSESDRERFLSDWTAVQAKFFDQPGQAIIDADHLIMEVMQIRAYPVSDFEQRAADISIKYPDLVSNYRAARSIAIKNEDHSASSEELKQAMTYYRSLFDELLKTEAVAPEMK